MAKTERLEVQRVLSPAHARRCQGRHTLTGSVRPGQTLDRRRLVLLALSLGAVFLALVLAALARAQEIDQILERFSLFNECRPVMLSVEETGQKSGISTADIQRTAELKLRGARLYTEDSTVSAHTFVTVVVTVVDVAFAVEVSFLRPLWDEDDVVAPATTWNRTSVGVHSKTPEGRAYVLSGLESTMDLFLIEYLRANEVACNGAGNPR